MAGGFLDRERAARLMAREELDVLLLLQPETIRYASGSDPGVAAFWRRAGAAMIVVPADPRDPMAAIVGDLQASSFQEQSGIADTRSHPIWVDTADIADPHASRRSIRDALPPHAPAGSRPATFDRDLAFGMLADLLAERGLAKARIGTEHAFLPVVDAAALSAACPNVAWADASELVARLRMIKHPTEMRWLALAASAAEAGLRAVAQAIAPGIDAQALSAIFERETLAQARRLGAPAPVSAWAYIAIGPDGFAPGGPAKHGDIVKVDIGCVVRGYSSDGARTFVVGEPSAAAKDIHAALTAGFEAGLAKIVSGTPLGEIYRATMQAVHEAGFPSYARGHVGHGLGASIWSEEWPFIAAETDIRIEPGMVLAFEVPWYVRGVGGFIIEDQFAITDRGPDVAWSAPRGLVGESSPAGPLPPASRPA